MPQYALKVQDIAPGPEVAHREGVAEGVGRESYALNTSAFPE